MGALFTVKYFCGCCDLKKSCVVMAAITIAANIIYLSICFFVFILFGYAFVESNKESRNENNKNTNFVTSSFIILVSILFFVSIIVSITTIICSYWFIKGVNSKNPIKMKYYLIILAINIIIQVLRYNLIAWMVAAFQCYVFICSYSVYEQLLNPLQEDGVNTTENTVLRNTLDPPPPYNVAYNAIENNDRSAGTYLKEIPYPLQEHCVNTTENTVIRNTLDPPPPPYSVPYNAIGNNDRSTSTYLKEIP